MFEVRTVRIYNAMASQSVIDSGREEHSGREFDDMFSDIGIKTTTVAGGFAAAGILTATTAFADPEEVMSVGQMTEISRTVVATAYTATGHSGELNSSVLVDYPLVGQDFTSPLAFGCEAGSTKPYCPLPEEDSYDEGPSLRMKRPRCTPLGKTTHIHCAR